jgi:hypothetical protein
MLGDTQSQERGKPVMGVPDVRPAEEVHGLLMTCLGFDPDADVGKWPIRW